MSSACASKSRWLTRSAACEGVTSAARAGALVSSAASATSNHSRPRTRSVLQLEVQLSGGLRDLAGDRLGLDLRVGAEGVGLRRRERLPALLLVEQALGELVELGQLRLGLVGLRPVDGLHG